MGEQGSDYARRRIEFYRTHADFMERRSLRAERERDEARREAERWRDIGRERDVWDSPLEYVLPWERGEKESDG